MRPKFTRQDYVTHNLLGVTRPVRVRITPADHAAMLKIETESGDSLTWEQRKTTRLQIALGRVLNPRYVAEVGLVPGTANGETEGRRIAVTLRRYVGTRLDPTPAFVVRGEGDDAPLSGYLDQLSTAQGARTSRITITLPEKALRRCMSTTKRTSMVRRFKAKSAPATTSLDVVPSNVNEYAGSDAGN